MAESVVIKTIEQTDRITKVQILDDFSFSVPPSTLGIIKHKPYVFYDFDNTGYSKWYPINYNTFLSTTATVPTTTFSFKLTTKITLDRVEIAVYDDNKTLNTNTNDITYDSMTDTITITTSVPLVGTVYLFVRTFENDGTVEEYFMKDFGVNLQTINNNDYMLLDMANIVLDKMGLLKVSSINTDTITVANNTATISSSGAIFTKDITAPIIHGELNGNASSASKLKTPRIISLSGDINGIASFNGASNIDIVTTIKDDSHNHTNSIGDFTVGGKLIVTSDLVVKGTTTYVNTEELKVSDNIITLNSNAVGSPTKSAGVEVSRGIEPTVSVIKFDETNDYVSMSVKQADGTFKDDEVAGKTFTNTLITALTQNTTDSITLLQNNMDTETTRATTAETNLQTNLDTETARATTSENEITNLLAEEISRAINADLALQNDLQDEISIRLSNDNILQSNIDTEKHRIDTILLASSAELDSFSEVVDLINSIDTTNDTAFAGYALATNDRISAVESAISSEINRSMLEDDTLRQNISTELSLRISEDEKLRTDIDNHHTSVSNRLNLLDSLLSSNDISLKTFQQIVDYIKATTVTTDEISDRLVLSENALSGHSSRLTQIESILVSNDITLDTFQEIVNFIKMNTGSSGTVSMDWDSILNKPTTFESSPHNHDTIYYTKGEIDIQISNVTASATGVVNWSAITNIPTSFTPSQHIHDDIYYTKNEVDMAISTNGAVDWNNVQNKPNEFVPETHIHDDMYINRTDMLSLYYNKAEIDAAILSSGASSWDAITDKPVSFIPSNHDHDLQYYTKAEIDSTVSQLSIPTNTDWNLISNMPAEFLPSAHSHNEEYYTKAEIDTVVGAIDLTSKSDITHTHTEYLPTSGGTVSGDMTIVGNLTHLTNGVSTAYVSETPNNITSYTNVSIGSTPTLINDGSAISTNIDVGSLGASITVRTATAGLSGDGIVWTDTLSVSDSLLTYKGHNVLHTGNLGDGSNVDADMVDGYHASVDNVPETVPVRDITGNITSTSFTGTLLGESDSAKKITTPVTIGISGDMIGSASFDGSSDINIVASINGTSHTHTISSITDFPTNISASELIALDGISSNIQEQINSKENTITGAITSALVRDFAPNAIVVTDTSGKLTEFNGITISELGTLHGTVSDIQLQLDTKETIDSKGIAGGYAGLDGTGKVPTSNLPAYIDEVLEYATLSLFPTPGIPGKIYVAIDTNQTYRWSGSVYAHITSGAVDTVNGKTGFVTISKSDIGLSNVDNTPDVTKSVLEATKLTTSRQINLSGAVSGTTTFNGGSNVTITTTVADDSHKHTFMNLTQKPTTLTGYGITDATPSTHIGSVGTAHGTVTTTVAGFMSSNDKIKLDGISVGATKYVHPTSAVTAGTYSKVTVDANGHITQGSSIGVSDIPAISTNKITSGVLPIARGGTNATTFTPNMFLTYDGTRIVSTALNVSTLVTKNSYSSTVNVAANTWYRIASSSLGIGRNSGIFAFDWAMSGYHGSFRITATTHYGAVSSTGLEQLEYGTYGVGAISKIRIVYTTNYTGNYAHIEVLAPVALSGLAINYRGIDLLGWNIIPITGGSIPAGYSNITHSFISSSSVSAGTYPKVTINSEGRVVSGSTLVASDIPSLDASKITTGTLSLNTATFTSSLNANGGLSQGGNVIFNGSDTWVRTYGNTGWYNSTYQGGLHMTDSTWIRIYNNKSFYQNTGILRTDGTLQVGGSGTTLNVPNGGVPTINGYNILHLGNIQDISPWTPSFTNVAASSVGTFTKVSGTQNSWDSQVCSNQGYVTNVFVKFSAGQTNTHIMAGLNSDPFADSSYASLDYSIYLNVGTVYIYESGSSIASFGTYTTNDIFTVHYDGITVRYYQNNTLLRTVARTLSTTPLYFDTSFYELNSSITRVGFGSNGYNNANALNGLVSANGNTANTIVSRDGSGNFTAGTITATLNGNSATTTKWATARTLTVTGHTTGTVTFDGSANVSLATTLANSGVTAGTYRSVTVDVKGRVTGATNPTTLSGYGITDSQPLSAELNSISLMNTLGLVTRTASGAYTARSIVLSGNGLTLTNPLGTAGNPTIAINAVTTNTASSIVFRDASGNFSAGTITATLSGNSSTTTQLATSRSFNITGDVTAPAFTFNGTANKTFNTTLSSTGVIAGIYGSATQIPTITVDAKGRITSATTTAVSIPSGAITVSGDVNGTGTTGATTTLTLSTTGVIAGTYKSVTVDAKGRVTAATNPTTISGFGITDAIDISQKGANNGVASLDSVGKIPISQLPSQALVVNSVAGKTGIVTLDKTDVGLSSVDNTSDINKPISSAMQTALNGKLNTGQLTSQMIGSNSPLAMAASNSTNNGSFVCRSSGTGDANLAGITLWNDSYAIKFGIRADGYIGMGGWSRAAWSWYSDPNGNMVAAGNVTAYSDPRLKDDVKKIENPMDIINSLDGVRYIWNKRSKLIEGKWGKSDIGILADQVKQVLPEIVSASIKDDDNGEIYDTVDYGKLVPVLIEAIKHQQRQIDNLASIISSLKGE